MQFVRNFPVLLRAEKGLQLQSVSSVNHLVTCSFGTLQLAVVLLARIRRYLLMSPDSNHLRLCQKRSVMLL